MKTTLKLTALIAILSLCSCNRLAKHYGGKMTVDHERPKDESKAIGY